MHSLCPVIHGSCLSTEQRLLCPSALQFHDLSSLKSFAYVTFLPSPRVFIFFFSDGLCPCWPKASNCKNLLTKRNSFLNIFFYYHSIWSHCSKTSWNLQFSLPPLLKLLLWLNWFQPSSKPKIPLKLFSFGPLTPSLSQYLTNAFLAIGSCYVAYANLKFACLSDRPSLASWSSRLPVCNHM